MTLRIRRQRLSGGGGGGALPELQTPKMHREAVREQRVLWSERDDIKGNLKMKTFRKIRKLRTHLVEGHKAFVDRMRRLSEVERKVASDFDRAVDRTAARLSLEMREKRLPADAAR